ncbi:MAG: cytochrome c oxidase subunit II [Chloroflexi bacterium]|nr:cytochrome c oxidase subunit II [Chloroflexota bacterium]
MKRNVLIFGMLWLILTAAGEFAAVFYDVQPTARSDKGAEIEHAFNILVYFAVPIFTMVVAALITLFFQHPTQRMPEDDGPEMHGRGWFPMTWITLTTVLTGVIIVYPGFTGIAAVMGHEQKPGQLHVNVTGIQWTWLVAYPDQSVPSAREIVLPNNTEVMFHITSRDVLHSFWVPAFLMKIDAVPGLETMVTMKTTELGDFDMDPNMRVQCTELCGTGHARMSVPVRVVDQDEFDAWVQENARVETPTPAGTPTGEVQALTIAAKNVRFDLANMAVKAGGTVRLSVDNQDKGVTHNWALYPNEDAARSGAPPIAGTALEAGPIVQELIFNAPEAGSYFFQCDAHPGTMAGTLVAE